MSGGFFHLIDNDYTCKVRGKRGRNSLSVVSHNEQSRYEAFVGTQHVVENACQLGAQRVPSSISLNNRRMILPEDVIGTFSTNCIARGTL
jgi:hypothetical protein